MIDGPPLISMAEPRFGCPVCGATRLRSQQLDDHMHGLPPGLKGLRSTTNESIFFIEEPPMTAQGKMRP